MASNYQKSKQTPMTLNDLLQKAASHTWKSPRHHMIACAHVRDAIEIMGRPLLKDVNTEMVDNYVAVVSQDLRPASVNRKLSALRVLLKYAYDREWIQKLPKFTWMKEDNERIRWLTADEEKRLLELLPEDVSAFCEILIHTGMRRAELLYAQHEQIDGDYLRLWKTKTGKARSVPLSPRAKELVDKWLPFNLTETNIRCAWRKAKKQMGLEQDKDFVLHMLRHTTATRMLKTTGNLAVVQKMLGHAKIATTLRYAHVADDTLLDAVRLTAENAHRL